jgi:hypothetical protein
MATIPTAQLPATEKGIQPVTSRMMLASTQIKSAMIANSTNPGDSSGREVL